MRAIVIPKPGEISVQHVPDPSPREDQVVVAVHSCGICGTDRHILNGDNPFAKYPVIPGHEFSGTIVELGSAVTRLELGDRVAVDPSYFCGRCSQCREGYPNLCPFKGGYGTAKPGALAEFVAVDEKSVERLPDSVSLDAGALAEPLACVIHGIDNLGPILGHDVLVYGGGPIGLMATTLLARSGAKSITMIEPNPARREAAAKFGATRLADPAEFADDLGRFHAVVDATGNEHAINDGFTRLRAGGRFLILGVAAPATRISISPFEINWRELRIIGSMAVRNSFGRAVEMLAAGFLDVDSLVSERLSLDELPDALDSLGTGSQLKTLIQLSRGVTES